MALMAKIDTLIARYVQLLVWQYQLPKAQGTIAIIAKQLLMDGLPFDVQNAYNVSSAVGPQLNVLGKYIGLQRTIGLPVALPWFGYRTAAGGGNNNGYASANSSLNRNVVYYQAGFKGTRDTALSDNSYAFMMALQIILNSSDGTLYSIQQYLNALLPGAVTVVDNKDMTLTYTITGVIPVDPAVLAAYLPKPMGVGITIRTNDFIVTDAGDNIVTDAADKFVTT